MGYNIGPVERQDNDIFDRIAYGFTTATTGAITNGSSATVSVTVTGVTLPTAGVIPNQLTWAPLAVWTSVNIGNLLVNAFVSAANTVTFIIHNNSGGTITPPASTVYGAVMGRLNQRFTQPNVPGGTTG